MERIQKILAEAGLCSRREAERLISEGRVLVNGKRAQLGQQADPKRDKITVSGKQIGRAARKKYIMLYKPRGVVSTMKDERGRKTVAALTRDVGVRVVPVGRLDHVSEGLLLMTNDGTLLHGLTHPRHEVPKHYEVRVQGSLAQIERLREPMEIDGYQLRPAEVELLQLDEQQGAAKVRITIYEGRNRQIRKMCEQVGLAVRRLKRVGIGDLWLDHSLRVGHWRALREDEVAALYALTSFERVL